MDIYSVTVPEFKAFGRIIEGFDTKELCSAMMDFAMPDSGVCYEAAIKSLENFPIFEEFENRAYGGMPIQLGMCWGYNTRLNCFEYHRNSEFNIGTDDFILLLAKQDEITEGRLDTAKAKAFLVPAGTVVEIYATTLHYAPCHINAKNGFRVAVVLPKGSNSKKPVFKMKSKEDKWMTARNKWLLAHHDSNEAKNGAYEGLAGENINLEMKIT